MESKSQKYYKSMFKNQKWVSTGIKVACGNKRLALQKAEEYRKQFEKSFN